MNPAAEPYRPAGILVYTGASRAALQLFGPHPKAARGASFSILSFVIIGMLGPALLAKISW